MTRRGSASESNPLGAWAVRLGQADVAGEGEDGHAVLWRFALAFPRLPGASGTEAVGGAVRGHGGDRPPETGGGDAGGGGGGRVRGDDAGPGGRGHQHGGSAGGV